MNSDVPTGILYMYQNNRLSLKWLCVEYSKHMSLYIFLRVSHKSINVSDILSASPTYS